MARTGFNRHPRLGDTGGMAAMARVVFVAHLAAVVVDALGVAAPVAHPPVVAGGAVAAVDSVAKFGGARAAFAGLDITSGGHAGCPGLTHAAPRVKCLDRLVCGGILQRQCLCA